VYTAYTLTNGISYGSATTYTNGTQNLTLDFYEPTADTAKARPLIIWAHGGNFISGTSQDSDVVQLSRSLTKKGFVCASINYRLGFYPLDSVHAIGAVVRAVQDMKAAIRFFYKDRATTNAYKIDTNNIFIAGSSAGAITALHVAYLDKPCEIQPYIDANTLATMGGLDGTSGNPGYSIKTKGVISLCGALAQYGWLEAGNEPLCSMHGTADATVIYGRGLVAPYGIKLMYLDGSRMIYKQAQAVSVSNNFYTWYNAGHVPYLSGGTVTTQQLYMDTTVNFVRDFLIENLACTNPAILIPNTPYGTATLYPYTYCATGIKTIKANLLQALYPNPSNSDVTVVFANSGDMHYMELSDISGRVIKSSTSTQATYILEKNNVMPGVYFLKVSNKQGESSIQKIIFY
jgi:para-nitrobenzyl esterase